MSQRRLLLDDDDDLPVRGKTQRWGPVAIPADRDYYNCVPCRGTGWEAFIQGGGVVCKECGGSGRKGRR